MKNENNEKKGVVKTVCDGFAESTREAHQISKAMIAGQKEEYKERHIAATEPDPGLEKVKQADGFKAKVKQIGENMKDGCKEAPEKERQRRIKQEEQMAAYDPYLRTKQQLKKEGKL